MTIVRHRRDRGTAAVTELLLTTALLGGLLSSSHCIGMCGGIATALGSEAKLQRVRLWLPMLYGFGRIVSYGAAGAVVGTAGGVTGWALDPDHRGEYLRVGAAVVVVLIGLRVASGGTGAFRWLRAPEQWGARAWRRLSPGIIRRLPMGAVPRALTMGLLWGWIPCGLVYSTLLAAAVAGTPLRGAATMLAFGLGTLPATTGFAYLGRQLRQVGRRSAVLFGAVIVASGLWTAVLPLVSLAGGHHQVHHGLYAVGTLLPH